MLGDNSDLINKLDEHLMTINNVMANRFIGNLRERVQIQQLMLSYLQKLLDEFILHQNNWSYLEPILVNSYATKNLTREARLFLQADALWRKVLRLARDQPHVKRLAVEYKTTHETLKILQNNNNVFERIKKALDDFLELKREQFQRFYFLSNQVLTFYC